MRREAARPIAVVDHLLEVGEWTLLQQHPERGRSDHQTAGLGAGDDVGRDGIAGHRAQLAEDLSGLEQDTLTRSSANRHVAQDDRAVRGDAADLNRALEGLASKDVSQARAQPLAVGSRARCRRRTPWRRLVALRRDPDFDHAVCDEIRGVAVLANAQDDVAGRIDALDQVRLELLEDALVHAVEKRIRLQLLERRRLVARKLGGERVAARIDRLVGRRHRLM